MPRFCVVVPTRDRPGTVVHTVASVLRQGSSDLELLVHDNSTTDATEVALRGIDDHRLRYVRDRTPVTMTGNWQAALELVDADWVTVVGDDDALLPTAIDHLERFLATCPEEFHDVISWTKIKYSWPERGFDANKLKIPSPTPLVRIDAKEMLRAVLKDARQYDRLPMLYNSFVPRSVLERIRNRAGHFVGSQSPDVYSGAAITMMTDAFVRMPVPLSVNGLSALSNGVNAIARPGNDVAHDWQERNRTVGLTLHPALPQVRGLSMAVFDSILTAADDLEVDLSAHLGRILCQIAADARAFDQTEATTFMAAIQDAAARSGSGRVRRGVRHHMLRHPIQALAPPEDGAKPVRPAFTDGWVRLNAQEFDVTNAAEAAVVAARFYDWAAMYELPMTAHRMPGRLWVAALGLADALHVRAERRRLV